ncbi:hypothetical protein ACSSNL_15525 [Thalassobius sp. S69A]|uniref:hypothetical protein n=1 Tax=unclassified Thalassovita TaxID=2619711 RepID=UPI000C0D9FCB|nr:hypothetical protein [Paracoccaceae bacterium]MBT26650.1 hypothetical protein [Paracoccaceae bacterium]
MTSQADFRTRWASMSAQKRDDFLGAIRAWGKLSDDQIAAFPDVPQLRDMMDCLCACEESYDKSIEKCKDSADPDKCRIGAREALTQCCAKCGD